MRRTAVSFVVVVIAGVSIWWMIPSRPVDILERANEAVARGEPEAAIKMFRTHLAKNPESSDARFRLAVLTQSTIPEESLAELRLITPAAPEYLDALHLRAMICLKSGLTAEAEQALLELEKKAPDEVRGQLALAELYYRHRKFQEALPRAIHASELEPERVDTFLMIAAIRDNLRQRPEMIAPLQKAIALAPESYGAHLNLAYAFHKAGKLVEAAEQARWCLLRKNDDVFAMHILASVARGEGRFEDAERQVRDALKLAPNDVDLRILEADLLLYRRKPDAAYQRLDEIYDEHRETFRLIGALARAAAASGHIDTARQLHAELARLQAENQSPSVHSAVSESEENSRTNAD